MSDTHIYHYGIDGTTTVSTVYRGQHFCGHVFCPTDTHSDFLASPWTDKIEQASFDSADGAISYLLMNG